MAAPDVVVVGGGAVGVAVTYELARGGASVCLLERGSIGAPESASAGNAGLICPSHAVPLASPRALREGLVWAFRRESPFRIRPRASLAPWLLRFAVAARRAQAERGEEILRDLSLQSLELHAELAASGLQTGFERRGILNVYETEALLAHGAEEARRWVGRGLQADVLTIDEARLLEPALTGRLVGAVHYPREAHCRPAQYVSAVGEAAVGAGAELRSGATVTGFRVRGRRIQGVETTDGPVGAGGVVLAAGAWTRGLAHGLGLRLPLEPAKGYHLDLSTGSLELPVFLQEARVVATPLDGCVRLAGTLEFAGYDQTVDPGRAESLRAAALRVLPTVARLTVRRAWAGFRPCAPDGLPIVGRPSAWENLWLATGHSMLGLTLAPVTAKIVGRLVLGREPDADIAELHPDRFLRRATRSRQARRASS